MTAADQAGWWGCGVLGATITLALLGVFDAVPDTWIVLLGFAIIPVLFIVAPLLPAQRSEPGPDVEPDSSAPAISSSTSSGSLN